jgi:NADPH2:quinone reductase
VEAFNIALLAQKGSLYAQRPSLFNYMADETRLREMAARLMEAVGSGKVKIAIHARYPLAEAANAHRALEARETTGATVLLP